MMQALLMMTLSMSLVFMLLSHPLSMGFILLTQAILVAMVTGLMSHNFWFSYILFMIMIGGMLVLFIYMTSVASNEKFLFSKKVMVIVVPTILIMLSSVIFDKLPTYQMTTNIDMFKFESLTMFTLSLSKYLNFPSNWIMIMMIIYLLVTLIAVVKITNVTYGPLRQKF